MGEIVMVSSLRDSGGVSFYDLATGSAYSHSLKSCTCETGGLAVIGGPSAFSGKSSGGSGDYIVASQAKKPLINIWQWGKPQVQLQCRIQEITTSISVDANGYYLFGGTKGGRIFCWEISSGNLVFSWQAHYKAVTTMVMTSCGTFLLSGADDGMVRAWDVPSLLTTSRGVGSKKSIPPFRSWTPHSLPIANIILQHAGTFCPSNLRAISVSADRTITIQEVFSNKQVAKIAFPEALTACTSNHTMDVVYLGSASGRIYILDLSITAVALSAAHAKVIHADTGLSTSLLAGDGGNNSGGNSRNSHTLQEGNYSILIGHDKAVTSLALAKDNFTLVSVSMDGTTKIWNTISRQCLKELNPFNKSPLSNVMLLLRPEVIDGSGVGNIHKPSLCPINHLRKYPDSTDKQPTASSSASVTQLDGNASLKGKNRRFFGGQSYSESGSRSCDLVMNPDTLLPLDMSVHKVQTSSGQHNHITPSLPGGEFVSLRCDDLPLHAQTRPSSVVMGDDTDMDLNMSMTGGASCPPVFSRQDTFGDEFYDNWKKNVKVQSFDAKSGMPSIAEANVATDSLSVEMQLQVWKRLATELQGKLDANNNTEAAVSENDAEDTLEEMDSEIEDSPKGQQSSIQKQRQTGPKMVILSETDRFKVPKNKGSGGGRKRYHEAFLEQQEEEARKKGLDQVQAKGEGSNEGNASKRAKKGSNSSRSSSGSSPSRSHSKAEGEVMGTAKGISRSKAAPPQARRTKNNKK